MFWLYLLSELYSSGSIRDSLIFFSNILHVFFYIFTSDTWNTFVKSISFIRSKNWKKNHYPSQLFILFLADKFCWKNCLVKKFFHFFFLFKKHTKHHDGYQVPSHRFSIQQCIFETKKIQFQIDFLKYYWQCLLLIPLSLRNVVVRWCCWMTHGIYYGIAIEHIFTGKEMFYLHLSD